jgi:peptide/nickel transport system ATP-binding protein
MSSEQLLLINDLNVSYTSERKKIHAVNNISLELAKGETLGLVGETGAGKTTIAKAILRILPNPQSKINSGEIIFDGENLLELPEARMRKIRGKRISMIFQDPMTSLNPVRTVGDQIAETVSLHENLTKSETRQQAVQMLEQVGIPGERYGDYPHQFSGGMKQRVIIAMALACHPELLLADEPTTALDVTIQAQVLDMMNDLKERYQTSLIMITHDLGITAEMCQKVAVIYAGEVVEYGKVEDIFNNPTHPYTIGLFGSIIDLKKDVEWLSPIPGLMPDPTNLPTGCKFNTRCPNCQEECLSRNPDIYQISEGHYVKCLRVGV